MNHSTYRSLSNWQWPQLLLPLRNTTAALAALSVAVFFHLECPYWAAMTTLIVIQPTRGLLFEKSFYRLVGTAIGSVAGLLLLQHTGSPMLLTVALAIWIAACVGIGNLLYGLPSYACMLAAFTCSVVALIGFTSPPHIYSIAFGRIAGIVVGIFVATIATALFTPQQSRDGLMNRLKRISGKTISWLALMLRQGRRGGLVRLEQEIMIEIAEIESLLDIVGAGSLRFEKQKRKIRDLVATLLSQLAVGRVAAESLVRHHDPDCQHLFWRKRFARHLDEVADKLASAEMVTCLTEMTATAAEAKVHLPVLGETLSEIVTSLQWVLKDASDMLSPPGTHLTKGLIKHRDWREAGRSAGRAALAIAVMGTLWSATGWAQGPMMLMAMSIMLSLFSSKEHPAAFVGQIFIGVLIGSVIAVFCRIVLLQGVSDPFTAAVILAPFLLFGVFAMSRRRSAIAAMDGTLFFIFITQPGVSVSTTPHEIMWGAFALVMGVGSAWLAYRFLVPISPAIRMRSLLRAITRDIEDLANPSGREKMERLRSRMHYRVIRLVGMAARYDSERLRLVEGGLAALAICRCIKRLQEALDAGNLSPSSVLLTRGALSSLSNLTRSPHCVLPALEKATIESHGPVINVWDDASVAERNIIDAVQDVASLFSGNVLLLETWGKLVHS